MTKGRTNTADDDPPTPEGAMIVPDLLRPGLILVLCGTAPSRASKEAKAYYAHPGNIFWSILAEVGLTPRRLAPAEYPLLPEYGIGLTDLNKSEWGADSELTEDGFDVEAFRAKMRAARPALIGFTAKHAARRYFGRRTIAYGRQAEQPDGIPVHVLPSTSGRARGWFDRRPWEDLAAEVMRLRGHALASAVPPPA